MTPPPLNVNLQHLIEAIDADLPQADAIAKVAEAQQRSRSLADIGDQLIDHFVTQARGAGVAWAQIGDALGVTRQAAQQRWVPPIFERFTHRARHVVVIAQERARGLRHGYIGTEHLLLGILDEPQGVGAQALVTAAGSLDAVRTPLLAMAPPGHDVPPAKIPFTERGKNALAQANAQANVLGHDYVGTEHLLLGLANVDGGLAERALSEAGLGYDLLRETVLETLAAG